MNDVEAVTLHQPVAVVLHGTHAFVAGHVLFDVEMEALGAVRKHEDVVQWVPAAMSVSYHLQAGATSLHSARLNNNGASS